MELHIPQRAEGGALGYECRDEKKRQTLTTRVSLLLFMDCQEKILNRQFRISTISIISVKFGRPYTSEKGANY